MNKETTPLWEKFLSGDRLAFESIYRSNVEALYDYGMRISKDENMTQDCIQELFIDLWVKRKNLGQTPNIRAYLLLSLRRRLYRSLKKSAKLTGLKEQFYNFELAPDIESVLIDEEKITDRTDKVKKAFESLSSQQKEVLYLKYERRMKSREIAEFLDMKDQSVRNLIHRAISKLRKTLVSALIVSTFWFSMSLLIK